MGISTADWLQIHLLNTYLLTKNYQNRMQFGSSWKNKPGTHNFGPTVCFLHFRNTIISPDFFSSTKHKNHYNSIKTKV